MGSVVVSKIRPVYFTTWDGGVNLPGWQRSPTSTAQSKKAVRAATVLLYVGPCTRKSSQCPFEIAVGSPSEPRRVQPCPIEDCRGCHVGRHPTRCYGLGYLERESCGSATIVGMLHHNVQQCWASCQLPSGVRSRHRTDRPTSGEYNLDTCVHPFGSEIDRKT
jgi:hypothetical protein